MTYLLTGSMGWGWTVLLVSLSSCYTTYRIQMGDLYLMCITVIYFGLQVPEDHTVIYLIR